MSRRQIPLLAMVLLLFGVSAGADDLGVTTKKVPGGVEVVGVAPKSLAEQLGLTRTDVIKKVNGKAVQTQAEVTEAVGTKRVLEIQILRSGKEPKTIRSEVFWPSKQSTKDLPSARKQRLLPEKDRRPPIVIKKTMDNK
jgi:C-terminal processing protease CtpA/Prc